MSKIETLVKELTDASQAYYNGEALISDSEFDLLVEKLKVLDPKHEFLAKVGSAPDNSIWPKYTHKQPMGSLLKIVDQESLEKWALKYTSMNEFAWADKLDGVSIDLEYKNGKLVRGITRGDGTVGDDITENVLRMIVPKEIPIKDEIYIRGEMIIPIEVWKKYFPEDKNPRNSASGTSRRIDGALCEHIVIIAFSIIGLPLSRVSEGLEQLKEFEFRTPRFGVAKSLIELEAMLLNTERIRSSLPYEIDGMVISENNVKDFLGQGEVDGRPRASRAYKFEAQQGISVLNEVIWQTGRTGVITPVAILKPVEISGVTVSRALLCNVDEISRLKIGIGSQVIVKRANDVIPKVVSAVSEGTEIPIPVVCPSCGAPTEREEIKIYCTDQENCPAQNQKMFINYLKVLGIKHMGAKLIDKLMDAGNLSSLSDLYELKVDDISELDRLGEKTALKVLKEIKDKSLGIPVAKFIGALGIPDFSTKSAEKVCDQYPELDQIRKLTKEELIEVEQVGELVAKSVLSGLERNSKVIDRLLKYVTLVKPTVKSGPLKGIVFCFTGFRDQELSNKAQVLGAEESETLTKKVNYLVAKDAQSGSAKLEKATKAGTKVIGIDEFKKLIDPR